MSEVPIEGHKTDKKVEPPFSGPLASFEAWLYQMVYEKVSFKIPVSAREWIVKYGPWITLVIGLLFLPLLLTAFTVSTALTTTAAVYGAYAAATVGPMFYVAMLMLVIQLVVMFASISPLLKRKRLGWQLLFYSSTLSLVYSVFNTFSYGYFNVGTLLGGLIGAAVSYYVIFQIRSYYK